MLTSQLLALNVCLL
ncbi:hypothetical protein ACPDPP_003721 [Vibrio cholerae]